MTGFDDFTMKLLTNRDILEMHRNSRHSHPVFRKVIGENEYILWMSVSSEGGRYLAVFNTGENDGEIRLDLEEAEICGSVSAKDLWSGESISASGSISTKVASHGAMAYYLKNA